MARRKPRIRPQLEKKTHDRTISLDRRTIADLRRANLPFATYLCYHVLSPTSGNIERAISKFRAQCAGLASMMTNRDIASAFRLLQLRPALCLVILAEPPCHFFGMSVDDVVLVYLAMPVGRCGSPAHFAAFGDAQTKIHHSHVLLRPDWNLGIPYLSRLYSDEGVSVELNHARRTHGNTKQWGPML